MVNATLLPIIGQPRCGSNLFVEVLGKHPNVLMHGELFNQNGVAMGAQWLRQIPEPVMRAHIQQPVVFLHKVVLNIPEQTTVVGFKLFRDQLHSTAHLAAVIAMAKHVIVLRRWDTLAWYISYRKAQLTGQFVAGRKSADTDAVVPLDRPRGYAAEQEAWFNLTDQLLTESRKSSDAVIRMGYEHDLHDLERLHASLKSVERFLGVPDYFKSHPPMPFTTRQSTSTPPRLSCSGVC